MKNQVNILFIGCFHLFISCINLSNDNSNYIPISDDTYLSRNALSNEDGLEDVYNANVFGDGKPEVDKIQLTGEIVQCNKCMGYGKVQEDLYAQPEICKFCWISTQMRIEQGWSGFNGRYGQVDAVFNTLPADFFDELDWNADIGFDEAGGTSSSEHIEAEIAMHEKNIAQIEHQLEYINGAINRTILEQRLIEEQYAIKRLRNMLNYK